MELTNSLPPSFATVLVVDDARQNLLTMSALLRDHYKVKVAINGERALEIAASVAPPDLILLDIMMPGMDGFEVCRRLKANPVTRDIAVIFLTARNDFADEKLGLDLGAVDYITKPISPAVALMRIKTHLLLKSAEDFLRSKGRVLEKEVLQRTIFSQNLQDIAVLTMAVLAETRESKTGIHSHIHRTQYYIKTLAQSLQLHNGFRDQLDPAMIEMFARSAPLHDIGKVGIPDRILLKNGSLNNAEFEVMQRHTTMGRDIMVNAEKQLGHSVPFLECAKVMAYSHQEKWDGSGYPQGLKCDDIPISARLMGLVDVYDALISRRVYRDPFSHEAAVQFIMEGRASHFDPDVTDIFATIHEQFRTITLYFSDKLAPTSASNE